MEREIYKLTEQGEEVIVLVRLKLTKDEYAQYRGSFLKEFNQLEEKIKIDKEEIVEMGEPVHPGVDPEAIKKALQYIEHDRKKDALRETIKEMEIIYEKSRHNCKVLKPLE